MFRLTRPLLNQLRKTTTGLTGLNVHHDPLPELTKTYQSTLSLLSSIPETSVYRQGVEALTQRKLKIVQAVDGNAVEAEKQLAEGQIEESLAIAQDELSLVSKMIEWKAYVTVRILKACEQCSHLHLGGNRWRRSQSLVNGNISGRLQQHHDLVKAC